MMHRPVILSPNGMSKMTMPISKGKFKSVMHAMTSKGGSSQTVF
jgi:hypothetical protein